MGLSRLQLQSKAVYVDVCQHTCIVHEAASNLPEERDGPLSDTTAVESGLCGRLPTHLYCPTRGACIRYTRWFRRTLLRCERPVHELPANPCKVLQLQLSRLSCHALPSATGQRSNPRMLCDQRICTRCQHGWGMKSTWSLSPRSCSTLEIDVHHCSRISTRCGLS